MHQNGVAQDVQHRREGQHRTESPGTFAGVQPTPTQPCAQQHQRLAPLLRPRFKQGGQKIARQSQACAHQPRWHGPQLPVHTRQRQHHAQHAGHAPQRNGGGCGLFKPMRQRLHRRHVTRPRHGPGPPSVQFTGNLQPTGFVARAHGVAAPVPQGPGKACEQRGKRHIAQPAACGGSHASWRYTSSVRSAHCDQL